jgi:hypothetical protein
VSRTGANGTGELSVRVQEAQLPRLPCMVPVARRWVGGLLASWRCVSDAELVVTELSTISIRYGQGDAFTVSLAATPDTVRLAVTDRPGGEGGPVAPFTGAPSADVTDDPSGDCGRSLQLVSALVSGFGFDHRLNGEETMWVEFSSDA